MTTTPERYLVRLLVAFGGAFVVAFLGAVFSDIPAFDFIYPYFGGMATGLVAGFVLRSQQ